MKGKELRRFRGKAKKGKKKRGKGEKGEMKIETKIRKKIIRKGGSKNERKRDK